MGFQTQFDDWQVGGSALAHSYCSPNLLVTLAEIQRRWPWTTNLGCFGARPIRGSETIPSSHSYGAAIDVGYPADFDDTVARELAPWIVARSDELHIDALHDYRRCRIWRAGRTNDVGDACTGWWKAQRPSPVTGMGQAWANHLHLEVTRAGWDDGVPAAERWTE